MRLRNTAVLYAALQRCSKRQMPLNKDQMHFTKSGSTKRVPIVHQRVVMLFSTLFYYFQWHKYSIGLPLILYVGQVPYCPPPPDEDHTEEWTKYSLLYQHCLWVTVLGNTNVKCTTFIVDNTPIFSKRRRSECRFFVVNEHCSKRWQCTVLFNKQWCQQYWSSLVKCTYSFVDKRHFQNRVVYDNILDVVLVIV